MSDVALSGRPAGITRVRDGFIGLIMLAMGAWGLAEGKVLALVFLVPGVVLLLNLRRRAYVDADRLVVQGRLARHEVPLREITQVAVGPMRRAWVQGQGRPVYLRMVWEGRDPGNPAPPEFVERLRTLAAHAGAPLRELPEGHPAPEGARPWFSI